MMRLLFLIFLLGAGITSAQDLTCLKTEHFRADYDLNQIQSDLEEIPSENDELYMVVFPEETAAFSEGSIYRMQYGLDRGFKVYMINTSNEEYNIHNMDGRITIRRQVFYKGEWRWMPSFEERIVYLCGNSFFTDKIIAPNTAWLFVAPCLDGDINVSFRFVASTKNGSPTKEIVSNEFEGFISKELLRKTIKE